MTNEEIFNEIKDQFAGVKMINSREIALLTKDGKEFKVNQKEWDSEYDIRFYCHGDQESCDENCDKHGSEYWEISKR